jgi:hypothetical protein
LLNYTLRYNQHKHFRSFHGRRNTTIAQFMESNRGTTVTRARKNSIPSDRNETLQGSGIHPCIPKSSQMYTQLLCTSPHKGASTTILEYTDSPPSQKKKKIAHPLAHFPRTYTIPNPNYKTPYRLNPAIYPPAPQIQIYTITSPYTPPKNYESQNNSTTTTNKRLGFREIDRSCHHHTAVQLPWLRTNRE